MSGISTDQSTGYVSEEELVQLAEEPNELAAGRPMTTTVVCGISAVTSAITALSSAIDGACPSTACTTSC